MKAERDLLGGWKCLTHPFVLFDPVVEHYELFFHACIYILDPPTFLGKNHTLDEGASASAFSIVKFRSLIEAGVQFPDL